MLSLRSLLLRQLIRDSPFIVRPHLNHDWGPGIPHPSPCMVLQGERGKFLAHPLLTWNNFLGKGEQRRWKSERAVPLAGIFFLDKAPEDAAEPLERARSVILLYDAAMYKYRFAMAGADQEEIRAEGGALFGSPYDAAQRIPTFTLRVSLHGRFWEEMEGVVG